MGIEQIIFLLVLLFAFGLFLRNFLRLMSYLRLAQPDLRWDHPVARIIHTIKVAFAQSKIFRFRIAGLVHAGIFWGFLMLLFSAAEAVIQGIFPGFSLKFLGPIYPVITICTEIFCVIVLAAVLLSLFRRYVYKVKRLQGDKEEVKDALIVLGTIFVIVSALLIYNSTLAYFKPEHQWMHPVSSLIASILPSSRIYSLSHISWWVHICFILAFANYLPFSKHFHVYTSIPNVFFSNYKTETKLEKIDFEKEGVEKFGVVDFEDLSWKSIFDGYSCTHCGRCTSVCPANITGKVLSPKEVIVQIRRRTVEKAPIVMKQKKEGAEGHITLTEKEQKILEKKFIGDYENPEALWQCTTCGACMQECPITIEHVPAIVGMRRSLVMMDADFPAELQPAFANLENNGSPWAFSPTERADWAEGLNVKTCADDPNFDILYWVGCAGSFDDRAKKISRAFARLLKIANVNFRILGTEEHCNGDPARRAGNEYLADMLIKGNVETLAKYNVKKIVTACPHCFNILKNEYPDFGGNYEVIHHTVFLLDLVKQGKLELKSNDALKKIAYHDSCYLGRYNHFYYQPRELLKEIGNVEIMEAERHGSRGLCCGAGGAQMFMEETKGKRVNIERTEELTATGASSIAVNCPFCMTMLSDGVKTLNQDENIEVKDIAEIILDIVES